MKRLEKIVLVQFFVSDAEEIEIHGNTAMLGPNGTGKTAFLDAIQIVMLGADQRHLRFNAKLAAKTTKDEERTLREYCLGCYRPGVASRDSAHTYISLVFRDDHSGEVISAGVAMTATASEDKHTLRGLYVTRGMALTLADHTTRDGDGDMLPLPWKDCEVRLKARAAREGATWVATDRPEAYVRELLQALQPRSRGIDAAEFQKIFRRSMQLNQISDVSTFVRDFLVEEERIDRAKAMGQVLEFERLLKQVVAVKEQIAELGDLAKKYRVIEREHRKLAAARALLATYQVEQASARCDQLADQLESDERQLAERTAAIERLEAELRIASEEAKEAELALRSDDQARDVEGKRKTLEHYERAELAHREKLQQRVSAISGALVAVEPFAHTPAAKTGLAKASGLMDRIHEEVAAGDYETARTYLADALAALEAMVPRMADAVFQATQRYKEAQAALDGERASLAHQRRGGARVPANVALAMRALDAEGIDARPVCEDLDVSDPVWQPSIEAYMATNLFALRVPAGREDAAVRAIRRQAQPLYDVKIIQPDHFRDRMNQQQDAGMLASLIEGADPVSVAYARQLFGGVRMVETEEELRRHGQSMTADGLLSKGGSTQRLRLRPAGELVMGRTASALDEQSARRRLEEAEAAVTAAERDLHQVTAAEKKLVLAKPGEQTVSELTVEIRAVQDAGAQIDAQKALISSIDLGHIADLQRLADGAREKEEALRHERDGCREARAALAQQIQTTKRDLADAEEAARRASDAERAAMAEDGYDAAAVDELRVKYDADQAGAERSYAMKVGLCQSAIEDASKRASNARDAAAATFALYLNRYPVDLDDDRRDWRSVLAWADLEHARLSEAKLHEYEAEAERAKRVAEQSFRTDIAIRLREAIERMKRNLKNINKLLAACPPFSNNERYKFVWSVEPEHRELLAYIENPPDDMFGQQSDIGATIIDMIKDRMAAGDHAPKTPIEDFRLMFRFDLEIMDGETTFAKLSGRNGKGSNGEHLTPYYVIAAAALAHAYRIEQGGSHDGAALMVMDEAFQAIDEQNAAVTARFISSMGLQLIMAGPTTDYGKIGAFTDTVYDLVRFGEDLHFTPLKFKGKAHELLLSDMPGENPEKVAQLAMEYAARDARQ